MLIGRTVNTHFVSGLVQERFVDPLCVLSMNPKKVPSDSLLSFLKNIWEIYSK